MQNHPLHISSLVPRSHPLMRRGRGGHETSISHANCVRAGTSVFTSHMQKINLRVKQSAYKHWAIPAACRPHVQHFRPKSHRTLCPRCCWSTPPLVPLSESFHSQVEVHRHHMVDSLTHQHHWYSQPSHHTPKIVGCTDCQLQTLGPQGTEIGPHHTYLQGSKPFWSHYITL